LSGSAKSSLPRIAARPALAAGTGAARPCLEQRPWLQILAVELEENEGP
jgi:hypothetical protein